MMASFSSNTLIVFIVACGITGSSSTQYPSVYNVKSRCGQTLLVHGDVRLRLASTAYLPKATTCSISFQPTRGKEVTAKFLSYHMNPAYSNEKGVCPIESIQLYDDYGVARLSSYEEYCSKLRPTANYFLSASGQLEFTTGQYDNILTADVDLLVSELSAKRSFINSTCPSTYFDCGNGYCISEDITCNGFDDCGNNSDESDCGFSLPTYAVAVIIAGAAFIIFLIIVLVVVIRRRRRRSSYTQHK